MGRPWRPAVFFSVLKLDPTWDKVRSDPGFQAEIKRYSEFDQP